MRRLLFCAAVLFTVAFLGPTTAVAGAPVVLNGGGNGTFDGVNPGSHFGLGVVYRGSQVQGHFNCLMAGNAAFDGLRLMSVEGRVTAGDASLATGVASFSGAGTLHVNGAKYDVTFDVTVSAGGPGVGHLQLTVNGTPPPFPNPVTFPPETVTSGQIALH